jgi:DNA-directed DNA polymerase III PolC
MAASPEFVHLHLHSEYSLLDGASRIGDLAEAVAAMGMRAVALTDHGALYGILPFYKACQAAGVKPIVGCELYCAPRSRFDKTARVDDEPYHFVVLARDAEGYKNLMRLSSAGYLEGFYYKPRVDRDLLAAHSKGLIALSSCLGAEVPQLLLQDRLREAEAAAAFYRDVFGRDGFFIELQDHGIPEQRRINPELVRIARRLGLGVVATNDAHYLRREDAHAHDVLLCIQTASNLDSPKRLRFPTQEFYVKTPAEMAAVFADLPEALTGTLAVAEQCNLELRFGELHLPRYDLPPGYDADSYLRKLCEERLPLRYPDAGDEVRRRLDYELGVIRRTGYAGYFLIVWDLIDFARRNGIPVGPGRGSAAGSMVTYVLGISNVDPLRFGLVSERFLNEERVDMPDIDIDFCYERRDEVIRYVVDKYGADAVAQIITFGTMGAKAVVRDVARAMGLSFGEADRIAKLIPNQLHMTLDHALEVEPQLRQAYAENPTVRELIDVARRLEGLPRHPSVHAAGIVIGHEPLVNLVPLARTADGNVCTQLDMDLIKDVGLLKIDLLGLRTLTVLNDAVRIIEETTGERVDLDRIPLDDPKTYRMLSEAQTTGVFQLESAGMRDLAQQLKPSNIEDVIAIIALYRPGPMENIPIFLKAKHGGSPTYPHPKLEPLLKDTYGIMIYQEQIMRVAAEMAGFTLGEADMLRRAMGKKKKEIMDEYRARFIAGCEKNGHPRALAEELYDQIEKFAGYGFNKCLTGDALVEDWDTGAPYTIEELMKRGLRPAVPSMDAQGRIVRGRVTDVVWNGIQPIYRVTTTSGRQLTATANHPFWTENGWVVVAELRQGLKVRVSDPVLVHTGRDRGSRGGAERRCGWESVARVEFAGIDDTYDLTVEPHHAFVANGFVVHNSHSAAYGLLSYQTAYLKANYPVPYMAALMTSVMGDAAKVAEYIAECRRLGVEVLPPDVNASTAEFAVADGRIRYGLAAVKNVGAAAIESIVASRRRDGPFRSLYDFCRRVDLRVCNRRAIESLCKAGAFDSLGGHRAALLAAVDVALAAAQQTQRRRQQGQFSLFDLAEPAGSGALSDPPLPDVPPYDPRQVLAFEKEVLGVYLSGHPLQSVQAVLWRYTTPIAELRERAEGDRVQIGGLIAAMRRTVTKRGESMAFLTIEDLASQVEVVVFPSLYEACRALLEPDAMVLVRGKVSWRDEVVTVVADEVKPLPTDPGEGSRPPALLQLDLPPADAALLAELQQVLRQHPGDVPVVLRFPDGRQVRCGDAFRVSPGPELDRALAALLAGQEPAAAPAAGN